MATETSDFPVTWREPGDAELSWEWDDMHMPNALAPLAQDYAHVVEQGFAYRYVRLEMPFEVLARVWNGYAYFASRRSLADGESDDDFDARMIARRREQVPIAAAYWRDQALPDLKAAYAWVDAVPVESMPAAELAGAWDEAWHRIERCWRIHFYAITGPYQVLDDLADAYEAAKPDATPGEALRLVQGLVEELRSVEEELDRLAVRVADPDVADALRGGQALPAAFQAALDAFLERHGHLGQSFDDLTLASWIEEPALLLAELGKRAGRSSNAAQRRDEMQREAAALLADVRERLASEPATLRRFDETLAHARQIGPLTEGHNYWIDRMAQSRLRRFVVRVGARLARDGVIDEPADIFYLHRTELPALIRDAADVRHLVHDRRETHQRQAAIRPPRVVGAPAETGGPGRFDGPRLEQPSENEIRGVGASAGVVRGAARVTLSPADFDRIQPGDIIVCPSSNPSWVPLFAVAAGLVTNTGGVLSHAAVVAREFALPAVVGTGDATLRIPDGRLIEIDGTTGSVRLL